MAIVAIEQRFLIEAKAQLEAEDAARFASRVRERALALQGEARRVTAGAARPTLAQMQGELASLDARPDWSLAAAEDQRRDWLRQEVYALTKRVA